MAEKLDARISSLIGGVAQLGERRVRNAKVRSSILLISTNLSSQINALRLAVYRVVLHLEAGFCTRVVADLWQTATPETGASCRALQHCACTIQPMR
jgi:hypothetical protein